MSPRSPSPTRYGITRLSQDVALVAEALLPVTDSDGQLLQPDDDGCFSGSGGVSVVAAADERLGATMQRHRIVGGRAADASRADEVVLSAQTAADHGIVVGDRILIYTDPDDCSDPAAWGEPTEVTVVGLTVLPGEIKPGSGRYIQAVYVSPQLMDAAGLGDGGVDIAVVLAPGATVADLRTDDVPAFDVGIDYADFEADVERGLRQDAGALCRSSRCSAGSRASSS